MELLRVSDLVDMTNLSDSKIYELKDEIGYYKLGGAVRFAMEDVLAWLGRNKHMKRNGKRRKPRVVQFKHLRG